jgi:hypothetical protein
MDYKRRSTRWDSFQKGAGWNPSNKPSTFQFVTAGFYATGDGDTVKCAYCGVMINDWNLYDNPMSAHELNSPTCIFIARKNNK